MNSPCAELMVEAFALLPVEICKKSLPVTEYHSNRVVSMAKMVDKVETERLQLSRVLEFLPALRLLIGPSLLFEVNLIPSLLD